VNNVTAKHRIFISDDSGPGPLFKTEYVFVAAEPGDSGSIIGPEGSGLLVAFHRTRLVAVVQEESICRDEA
jgi:hypothetical protein